jgi:hypothetical protein
MAQRKRRRSVTMPAIAIAATLATSGLAGCGSEEPADPDYAALCVDRDTGQRVSDDRCGDDHGTYQDNDSSDALLWYFIGRSQAMPPVGGVAPTYAVRTVPRNAVIARGFSAKGGTVTRGGFGSTGARGIVGTGAKAGSVGGGHAGGGSVGG